MARVCRHCGRAKNPEEHAVLQVPVIDPDTLKVKLTKLGRPKMEDAPKGFPGRWACKLRMVAVSPRTGKVLTPAHPQRTKEVPTAFVHESRLQPGGDLHAA